MADKLDSIHNIDKSIYLAEGNARMPKIVMAHCSGSSAEMYLHGAHITSWKDSSGVEKLFMSNLSDFNPSCAIRGGIPIIFPQFGDGALPKHGFARNMDWELIKTSLNDDGVLTAIMQLVCSDETLRIWNHSFAIKFVVTLNKDSLALKLIIKNTGSLFFQCQTAFHTYFSIKDICSISAAGLQGSRYIDTLRNMAELTDEDSAIKFTEETDRIYLSTPDELHILDGDKVITNIRKRSMPDVVVWNPWIDKSIRLKDFGDNEYKQMVCVETGCIKSQVQLLSNEIWEGETILSSKVM